MVMIHAAIFYSNQEILGILIPMAVSRIREELCQSESLGFICTEDPLRI